MAVASGRIAGERKDNRLAKRPQTPGSRVREMKRKRISPVLCLFVLITGGLPTAPVQIPREGPHSPSAWMSFPGFVTFNEYTGSSLVSK